MKRTKRQEDVSGLPEPIALTPDQLKEVATETAGGTGDCGYINPTPLPGNIHGGLKANQ